MIYDTYVSLAYAGTTQLKTTAKSINLSNVQTGSAGLSTGDVYRSGNYLLIV
jgi:hypothetical protein